MTLNRPIDVLLKVSCALWLLSFASLQAGEPDSPMTTSVCESCHGTNGVSKNPLVPILAGQPYTLIEDNLLAFRAKRRICAPQRSDESPSALLAKTMCTTVASLEDTEITALAAFFERQAFIPAEQAFESTLTASGSILHIEKGCERCHSQGGRQTNAMAPILAGQWMPYLRRAMDALRSGTRKGPKVMNTSIHNLNENEVEALLQYYASQQEGMPGASNP